MYRSVLQTKEWATLKAKYGQTAHWLSDVLALEHKLPFGRSFIYLPEIDQVQLHDLNKDELDRLAWSRKAVFVRAEIVNPKKEQQSYLDKSLHGFVKSFESVQPEHRQIVDLRLGEEELLRQMKPKGRYNIKVAARHKVNVADYLPQSGGRLASINHELEFWGKSEDTKVSAAKEGIKNPVAVFYDLYQETTKREKITGRSLNYFNDLVDILGAKDYVRVFIAYLDKTPLAAAIVTFYQGVASYLYGGSSREHKEAMAPFALHWVIMQEAKRRRCSSYDLLGMAPEGDVKHKWAGLSRFKENFGGQHVELIGSYDKVYEPRWYRFYRLGQKIRRRNN